MLQKPKLIREIIRHTWAQGFISKINNVIEFSGFSPRMTAPIQKLRPVASAQLLIIALINNCGAFAHVLLSLYYER